MRVLWLGAGLLGLACVGSAWAQANAVGDEKGVRRPAEAVPGGVRLLPKELPEDPLADLPGELPVAPGGSLDQAEEPELFGGPGWESPVDGRTPGLLGEGESDSVLDTPLEPDVDEAEAERQRALAQEGSDPAERFLGSGALDSPDGPFEDDGGQLGSEYRDPVEW